MLKKQLLKKRHLVNKIIIKNQQKLIKKLVVIAKKENRI